MIIRTFAFRVAGFSCLSILLLASGCNPPAAPDTRAADESAIKALDEEWSKTAATLDVDATVAYYAEDAYLLPPNEPLANGKEAIRKSWAALLAPGTTIGWKVTKVEVSRSGELGYVVGTYQLSMKDAKGNAIPDRGKLVEVWKKQTDGKWKVVADAFNSDMPAAAAPAPAK